MSKIRVKNVSPIATVCGIPPRSTGLVRVEDALRWPWFLHALEDIEASTPQEKAAQESALLDTVPAPNKGPKRRV